MKIASQAPRIRTVRAAGSTADGPGLVLKAGRPEDVLALSAKAAQRFAADTNGNGRIDAAEAQAFAKAAELPQAPGFFAKLLDSIGLKKLPAPSTTFTVKNVAAGPDLAIARAAQRYLETAIGAAKADGLDWTAVTIAKAGADYRVTVKGADGADVQTLVVSRDAAKPGAFKVATQLEAAMVKAKAALPEAYHQQIAESIVKDLAKRAKDGWAPEIKWETFQMVAAPMDSEVAMVSAKTGKDYRFLVVWGEGETEHLFVQPAQILDMYSSGIEDWTVQRTAEGIFEALKPQGNDGWPPSVDWKTLTITGDRATVKDTDTGRTFAFSLKRSGKDENLAVVATPIE